MTAQRDALGALGDALDRTGALVAAVPPDAAHTPTPCTSFDVRQLTEHIVADLVTFTSTAAGDGGGKDGDGASGYDDAARALVDAWRRGGVEGRTLHSRIGELPATWALSQQTADVIVHGWDLARATGQQPSFDDAVVLDMLEWARQNLRPEFRGDEASGKSFGAEIEAADDAPPLDRLVAFFGRDPAWTPPA